MKNLGKVTIAEDGEMIARVYILRFGNENILTLVDPKDNDDPYVRNSDYLAYVDVIGSPFHAGTHESWNRHKLDAAKEWLEENGYIETDEHGNIIKLHL